MGVKNYTLLLLLLLLFNTLDDKAAHEIPKRTWLPVCSCIKTEMDIHQTHFALLIFAVICVEKSNKLRNTDTNAVDDKLDGENPIWVVLSSEQRAERVKLAVVTKRLSDNMMLSSIISWLAGLAALAPAPKWLPSSLLLCQPGARLSEWTLPGSMVFISPRRDAEVSQILNQLNMHSVTR